ncbi:fibronectin type III domain-containing protein [Nocardioides insulae]|uniref:fibronectin type III domain-containing protein n=1 Tax=Nocardioides insulae TaxID=394734 RepID=UPI00041EE05E|nr:fibronectin type III domain-containing protein [Nocardioides insulae]
MGKAGTARRYAAPAPYLALLLVVVGLSWVAVRADGYQAHDPELHDGGVWVTNRADGFYGRMNKPINQLDSALPTELGSSPDVVQDGAGVVGVDLARQQVATIDPAGVVVVEGDVAAVPAQARVGLSGGTLAVVDPADGRIWGTLADSGTGIPAASTVDAQNDPIAELGGDADLAVSTGGTAVVLSAAADTLSLLRPSGADLGAPETRSLDQEIGPGSSVTTVGEAPVVLDGESGTLLLPSGATSSVSSDAVLQQPGPEADEVVLADGGRLVTVDLETGDSRDLTDGIAGTPAEPVRLGACVFGAWSSMGGADASVAQRCGGGGTDVASLGPTASDLVFRVNRGEIVLNDRATGSVWDLDTDSPTQIDDWEAFKKEVVDSEDAEQQQEQESVGDRRPPKAEDDRFGARPGRLTVLHPLDNDAAPQGRLLSIRSVDTPHGEAEVTVSPDGQTVQIRLPEGTATPVTFTYHVDDGTRDVAASAEVTVTPRSDQVNARPTRREGYDEAEPERWAVPAGGVLDLPVLPDWRDYGDGDPLGVTSATVSGAASQGAEARVAGDGRIRLTAPARRGEVTVDYVVGDAVGESAQGSVSVLVQDATAREAVAPRAQPDVVTGEAGEPILIRPLANDHPGSDPLDPNAALTLAGEVTPVGGAQVTTDRVSGTLSFRAEQPRTYFLEYDAAYGNSAFSRARIRVDVRPADDLRAPVAVPDQASLVGQSPRLVDVLANDVDPAGQLLTVQSAEAESEALDVTVVEGRWVRVSLRQDTLAPSPQTVSYTISNGASSAEGEVVVTQRPDQLDPTPVTEADPVTVRAGASVSVPVLDNDFSPTGEPVQLVDDVAGAEPGQLTVRPSAEDRPTLGNAYVAGRHVRYVAPGDLEEAATATIDYQASVSSGESAPGTVEVTVLPADDNRVPEPPALEGRVTAGDRLTLRLPGAGVDPDGDPVTLTSISTPPRLGRVLNHGANSLVYEAFPDSGGTDEFGYTVEDEQGGTAEGTVRVAVAPPAEPQPPLAVDDTARVAPGRTVRVDAVANDHVAAGDRVTMELVDPPEGVELTGDTGPISVRAPEDGGDVSVVYTLGNGVSTTRGTVLVRSVEGYDNPPIVPDAFGRDEQGAATSSTVTVDLLANATDPDGPDDALRISQVVLPAEEIYDVDGGSLTLPRGDEPSVVPVRVTDADGGATTASVYVPARDESAPYARGSIELDPGQTRTVDISEHVVDPAGGEVRLTLVDRIWTSPEGQLAARTTDERTIELTAGEDYQGPAAVSFEVTTGRGVDDAEGRTGILTVPVQVGETAPVLRCPEEPIGIAQGQSMTLDVSAVCHTWTTDPEDADGLEYAADWQASSDGLSIIEPRGRRISVAADGDAKVGSTGRLTVSTEHGATGVVPIVVTAQPAPTLAPVSVDDLRAGEERTLDLANFLTPGVDEADPRILEVTPLTTLDVDARADGSRLILRTGDRVHGPARFRVEMTDVAGEDPPPNRRATTTVRAVVRDRPATPAAPVPGRTVRSQEVQLSWRAPESNGSPIDRYRVTGTGDAGTTICATTTCTVDGLTNGRSYSFTVQAHNALGWSETSRSSAQAVPDAKPGQVGPIRLQRVGEGQLVLAWNRPERESSIDHYLVSWPGGGEARQVTRPQAAIGGLDNEKTYAFSVVAVNDLASGPVRVSAPHQSVGTPAAPARPRIEDRQTAGDTGAVEVTWSAVPPNGPGPVTYTVLRNGTRLPHCTGLRTLSCVDAGMRYDGTSYRYQVTATNAGVPGVTGGAARTSRPSAASSWAAVGSPAAWQSWSVTAPKADRRAKLTYSVPDSRGEESTVRVYVDGTRRTTLPDQHGTPTRYYSLGVNAPHRIALQLCNESGCGPITPTQSVQTAGPLDAGTIRATGTPTGTDSKIRWSISWDSEGAPTRITVKGINTSRNTAASSAGVGPTSVRTGDMGVGASTVERLRITIQDRSEYGRSSVSAVFSSARTPAPNRTVNVTRGSQCNDDPSFDAPSCQGFGIPSACTDKTCGRIQVHLSGFGASRVTCTFHSVDRANWGHSENFAGNGTYQADAYYGKPEKEQWIRCQKANGSDGIEESNHHPWPTAGFGGG